jgi:3-isopropylmalate/(R)-2-methylmalate dehydratase small subunit
MEAFVRVSGIAAALMQAHIDTDLLIPSREITSTSREGYGPKLLAPWRYLPSPPGAPEAARVENPDFVLNREPWRRAVILIAGPNFGSGSSREAAAWAVRQFGLRCVIAPSFGAIFRANCLRNGVLPVVLPAADVQALADEAERSPCELTVDLERCRITRPGGGTLGFAFDAAERRALLEGRDAIDATLEQRAAIEAFQRADRERRPWIWLAAPPGR